MWGSQVFSTSSIICPLGRGWRCFLRSQKSKKVLICYVYFVVLTAQCEPQGLYCKRRNVRYRSLYRSTRILTCWYILHFLFYPERSGISTENHRWIVYSQMIPLLSTTSPRQSTYLHLPPRIKTQHTDTDLQPIQQIIVLSSEPWRLTRSYIPSTPRYSTNTVALQTMTLISR